MPTVSVVVPTLIKNDKQLALTFQCLEAKKKTKIEHETVIVETCSNYLEDYADTYIYEPTKSTDTKSFNAGFTAATGDYVVLLTNDVIVDHNWLECLLECFEKKPDCGIATLATDQFNHQKRDEISEGVWFSVAMFTRQDTYFDELYVNSWNDTDFIMRMYLKGLKSYRNYNCVVHHEVGATQYSDEYHYENYRKNAELFKSRYRDTRHRMYDILTNGIVI